MGSPLKHDNWPQEGRREGDGLWALDALILLVCGLQRCMVAPPILEGLDVVLGALGIPTRLE